MRHPDLYVDAQSKLFAKVQTRAIRRQHWSKYLMTPKELALLFSKLEKSNSVLREIAKADLGKSGELARKQLGIE